MVAAWRHCQKLTRSAQSKTWHGPTRSSLSSTPLCLSTTHGLTTSSCSCDYQHTAERSMLSAFIPPVFTYHPNVAAQHPASVYFSRAFRFVRFRRCRCCIGRGRSYFGGNLKGARHHQKVPAAGWLVVHGGGCDGWWLLFALPCAVLLRVLFRGFGSIS